MFKISAFSVFFCHKCQCTTSGIIPEGKAINTRWCTCHSQLVQCDSCFSYTSTTVKGGDVICDRCQKPAKKQESDVVQMVI